MNGRRRRPAAKAPLSFDGRCVPAELRRSSAEQVRYNQAPRAVAAFGRIWR